ncbi:MAG: PKD domain-containing protein [Bacteroidota bacterium]
MKKLFLLSLVLLHFYFLSAQCLFEVCLTDTYGDGWNGNTINVFVNGSVAANYTLSSGYGPVCYDISVNNGDVITINFVASGSWTSECDFYLYNPNGTQLGHGDDGVNITNIAVTCPCGPTSVIPDPMSTMNCGGIPDTITFSTMGSCSGNMQYQVWDGGTIVQPWSTTTSYIASPMVNTTFTVEARCSACPGTVVSDTFYIEVIPAPLITGITSICAGNSTTLTASGSTGDFEWWTEEYGGVQLDTSASYTTPALYTTTSYWVQANGQTSTQGKILITECGLEGFVVGGDEDYIEISNLYSVPVNTSGWVVAVSNSYSNINTVNSILWHLPSSFAPCSVVYKDDDASSAVYWGTNIYWNPTYSSWAIIIDDVGNVVDFCCWGWTAADLATFNPTINGFSITLGPEWTGNGCSTNCSPVGGVPYSIQRIGNTDSNTLSDFVCQASTVAVVNPGLSCGWTPVSCRFEVLVTVLPGLDIDSVFTNPSCAGGSDGTINLTINTGVSPYSFSWSSGDITQNLTGLSAGTYDVTATDAMGCTGTCSVTLTDPPAITASGTSTDENCNQSDGTLTVTGSGGTGSLTYDIGNGAQASGYFAGLTAGPYIVTVTDSYGCTGTLIVAVNGSGNVNSGFSASPDQCLIGNSFDFTNTGDTGAGITWSWSFPNANTPTSGNENPTGISWSMPGQYVVTQTAIYGACNDVTTYTIEVYEHPTVSITTTDVVCNGICDGTATATASGGTAGYSCSWNDPGSQTGLTATGLCAGTFSVTVTDSHTCTCTGSGVVSQNNAVAITSESSSQVSCYGDYDGSVSISASGGASPLSYNIGAGNQASGYFANLAAGTYTVTVTDANGCTVTGTPQTITEPPQITAVIAGTDILCHGQNNGAADLTVVGGSVPYTFHWSNSQATEDLSGISGNTYGVTVTDAEGCTTTAYVTITEPAQLVIIAPDDKYICNGQVINLTASASGGTGAMTFYWNGVPGTATYSVSPGSQTTYTVYVVDQNNCQSATESVTVNVSPNVVMELFANETYVCPGDPAVISANIYNGVPPYYVYDSFGGVISPPVIIAPFQDTSITLFVEDQCGSLASDDIQIGIYPLPPVSFATDNYQGCVPFTVNFIENSPAQGQSFVWNFGDNDLDNLSFSKNPEHTYDDPGVYDVTLTVTSAEGCVNQMTIWQMIHVFVGPIAKFMADPEVASIIKPIIFFENQSIDADDYTWVFGDGDTSNVINPWHTYPIYPTGAYNVMLIAHTNKGCADTAFKEIVIKNEITFYAPSAFSPDFDGINDFFLVKGNGLDPHNFKLIVYDRWGELVFESDDLYDGWDGRIKGGEIGHNGTYTWLCIYRDMYGTEHQEAGAVTIIR